MTEKVCKMSYMNQANICFTFCFNAEMLTAVSVGVNAKFLKFKHVLTRIKLFGIVLIATIFKDKCDGRPVFFLQAGHFGRFVFFEI